MLAKAQPGASLSSAFFDIAERRRAMAHERALNALQALEATGLRAWVIGSLVKGSFSPHSDVDFVVDCPPRASTSRFGRSKRQWGTFRFT
jgi:predicted nucleotidyltransferase